MSQAAFLSAFLACFSFFSCRATFALRRFTSAFKALIFRDFAKVSVLLVRLGCVGVMLFEEPPNEASDFARGACVQRVAKVDKGVTVISRDANDQLAVLALLLGFVGFSQLGGLLSEP